MKRATFAATIAFLLVAGMAHAEVRGAWSVTRGKGEPGRIHLNLSRGDNNLGQTMKLADLTGLTAAQVASATATPVSFSLRREAGTVTLEGVFRNGSGGGEFELVPNPAFVATLRDLGVAVERGKRHGRDSAEEQLLTLAVLDVSAGFIRSMQAVGYRESLDEYVSMRIFNLTPALVTEYRALGMPLSTDELVTAQIHGVSPTYVKRMRELGQAGAAFDQLVASRIHGATPELIDEMRQRGYGDLRLDDYIAFRIHGVTPRFVEELAELGYRHLAADDLVAFRIHGVTPEFIRDLAADGERNVSADDLVSMKIHGSWRH